MKRNKNLITLSWEHHDGLVVAFRLQQGLKKNIPVATLSRYILFIWDEVLHNHFWQEEQTINGHLEKSTEGRTSMDRMMNEHGALQTLIHDIKKDLNNRDHVSDFSSLLHDHIRFEERELFPLVEAHYSEPELGRIGEFLQQHHQTACREWPDAFWQKS